MIFVHFLQLSGHAMAGADCSGYSRPPVPSGDDTQSMSEVSAPRMAIRRTSTQHDVAECSPLTRPSLELTSSHRLGMSCAPVSAYQWIIQMGNPLLASVLYNRLHVGCRWGGALRQRSKIIVSSVPRAESTASSSSQIWRGSAREGTRFRLRLEGLR